MKKKIIEIIEYIRSNNLFTNSKTHEKAYERFKNDQADIKFILTNGIPSGTNICRECQKNLPTRHFSYYMTRVANTGYLQRSNAICDSCSKTINKARKDVLEKANIPEAPKKNSIYPRCKRQWAGNWHRDHSEVTGKFNEWLCGNCNMAKGDQRNPHIKN